MAETVVHGPIEAKLHYWVRPGIGVGERDFLLAFARQQDDLMRSLVEALEEVAKAEGPYSRDELTHATNTVEHMQRVAVAALAKVKEAQG